MIDEHGPDRMFAAEALLGELLTATTEQARDVFDVVRPTDIPSADLRLVYTAAQDVLERDGAIDVVMVRDELAARNGMPAADRGALLARLMPHGVTTANIRHHAKIVARGAAHCAQQFAALALSGATDADARAAAQRALDAAVERAEQVERWEDAAKGPKPLILDDAADMMEEPEEGPPESLIERLIVRPGVVILFGASGSGKSWALMAGLYDLVQGGGAFCGVEGFQIRARTTRFGDEPDRVLWVYGSEDNRRRIKRRIRTCGQYGPHAGKPLGPGLFMPTSVPEGACLASPKGLAWLRRAIEQTKATVVVLDTIQSLVSSIDTNKGELVAPFMVALHQIRDATGAVIIPVHHTKKASGDAKEKIRSKADTLLGSQAWRALADGVVMIDAADGDASDAEVRLVKGKDIDEPCAPVRVTMDGESKRFRPLEDEEEAPARTDARKAPPSAPRGRPAAVTVEDVVKLRRRFPEGVQWGVIYDTLGVGRSTWFRVKQEIQKELLGMGHVVVSGLLKWGVSSSPENSPEMQSSGISGHPSVPSPEIPPSPPKGGEGRGTFGTRPGPDGPKLDGESLSPGGVSGLDEEQGGDPLDPFGSGW